MKWMKTEHKLWFLGECTRTVCGICGCVCVSQIKKSTAMTTKVCITLIAVYLLTSFSVRIFTLVKVTSVYVTFYYFCTAKRQQTPWKRRPPSCCSEPSLLRSAPSDSLPIQSKHHSSHTAVQKKRRKCSKVWRHFFTAMAQFEHFVSYIQTQLPFYEMQNFSLSDFPYKRINSSWEVPASTMPMGRLRTTLTALPPIAFVSTIATFLAGMPLPTTYSEEESDGAEWWLAKLPWNATLLPVVAPNGNPEMLGNCSRRTSWAFLVTLWARPPCSETDIVVELNSVYAKLTWVRERSYGYSRSV